MSTDYVFACEKCKQFGGGFSRQAWGTGNANIIDSFRFIMKHRYCERKISIIERMDTYDYYNPDLSPELLGYFPHSDEWEPAINQEEYQKYLNYCNGDK